MGWVSTWQKRTLSNEFFELNGTSVLRISQKSDSEGLSQRTRPSNGHWHLLSAHRLPILYISSNSLMGNQDVKEVFEPYVALPRVDQSLFGVIKSRT